jgi:hypothetical protein
MKLPTKDGPLPLGNREFVVRFDRREARVSGRINQLHPEYPG